MSTLNQLKVALEIPEWFILNEQEVETLTSYLFDAESDVQRAFWAIRLDCSACCSGCIFCEPDFYYQPVCKSCKVARSN